MKEKLTLSAVARQITDRSISENRFPADLLREFFVLHPYFAAEFHYDTVLNAVADLLTEYAFDD